jgi:hypothetical protein
MKKEMPRNDSGQFISPKHQPLIEDQESRDYAYTQIENVLPGMMVWNPGAVRTGDKGFERVKSAARAFNVVRLTMESGAMVERAHGGLVVLDAGDLPTALALRANDVSYKSLGKRSVNDLRREEGVTASLLTSCGR